MTEDEKSNKRVILRSIMSIGTSGAYNVNYILDKEKPVQAPSNTYHHHVRKRENQ